MGLKKVLVVEDDYAIRDTFAELLQSEGYDVVTASNGEEGILALKNGPPPNLILLDLMMPIKDGFEFREEQLQEPKWADIPVIVMSADGQVKEKLARTKGADYLKKPTDLEVVLDLVRRYCV
jgi:CheY-like chemotaxis protein